MKINKMAKLIISVKTERLSLVKFYLEKRYEGEECFETVYIRYGTSENFLPCSTMQENEFILLHKAGIGNKGDVKLKSKEWLKALKAMGSKELFNKWSELINNKQAA
jgi:hypothetical protein